MAIVPEINLTPEPQIQPEDNEIDLNQNQVLPVSPEVASSRAAKAQFALPNMPQTYADYYEGFQNGQEPSMRDAAAAQLDVNKGMQLHKSIANYARFRGGIPTPEEQDRIKGAIDQAYKPTDPTSVFEDEFAKQYMQRLDSTAMRDESTFLNPQYIPYWLQPFVGEVKTAARTAIAKTEFAKRELQDAEELAKGQSWGGYLVDVSKDLATLGLYQSAKLRGQVEGSGFFEGGLMGSNLAAQATRLNNLPYDQFKKEFPRIMNQLKQDNPGLAVQFGHAVVGLSTSEITASNILEGINLATFPGIGKVVGKAAKSLVGFEKDTKQAAKSMMESLESTEATQVAAAEGAGDIGQASVTKSVGNLVKEMRGQAIPERDAVEALPSALKADGEEIKANKGSFSRELVNRIAARTTQLADQLVPYIQEIQKVQRIPAVLATEKAIQGIKEEVRDLYRGIRNDILDISDPYLERTSNTYLMDMQIGNKGELFSNRGLATIYAKRQGLENYPIEKLIDQRGTKFFIKITRPLDETSDVVNQFVTATKNSESPNNFLKNFLSWVITPENTLSVDQRMNRHIATYAPSEFLKLAKEQTQEIQNLASFRNRKLYKDWERVVRSAQDMLDPATGDKGFFFRHPVDVEEKYMQLLKRPPEAVEVEAYFAFKRLMEMDRVFRNISVYRNKARVGTEQHRFFTLNKKGNRISSDFFDGMRQKTLPGGEGSVLFVRGAIGRETVAESFKDLSTKARQDIEVRFKKGELHVVEVFDPETRPISTFGNIVGGRRIRYVISSNMETKPLSWNQVPRRGGGHIELDYDHYIKQPRIRWERFGKNARAWYEGDSTLMPITLRKMGVDVADKMNAVVKLIKAGREEEAKALAAQTIPVEWKELRGWFNPRYLKGVQHPARFSLDEEFHVVPRNSMIVDMDNRLSVKYGDAFRDGTKRGSAARQSVVEYTGERDAYDLFTINDKGNRRNPMYAYEPAKTIDPMATMDRALSRIVNSYFMDDYKVSAIQNWIKEATPFLKGTESEFRYSPYAFFRNAADRSAFRSKAPEDQVRKLLANRYKIQQFLGVPSSMETFLYSASTKLADQIYSKFGPTRIDPTWMLPFLKDPSRFIRGMTFHDKLGLFNIPQIITQNLTYVNIMSLAGIKNAGKGTFGAMMHQWSRVNEAPQMLAALDAKAAKMGWRAGEWLEGYHELKKTGFANVAGEYALRDYQLTPKLVQNAGKTFLDWGATFFTEGERNVRLGAWYTAFKEFRDLNPVGRITDLERGKILSRADLLQLNMSRASNSALHSGVFSIPMQFYTYQLRTIELFASNRISWTDRARMVFWNSLLFGVPASAGLTGLPAADYIRKYALDNGYQVGEKFWQSLFFEGLPAMMIALATGKGDYKRGNYYNITEKGVQGLEQMREAMRSDKTMWDIIGGASFSTLRNTIAGVDGFYAAMMSAIRDDQSAFPMKVEDFVDIFKEITTVNSGWRYYLALNTGRWISKKDNYLSDVSMGNALFMTLAGLQPQNVSDLNLFNINKHEREDVQKYVLNKFVQEFRRGLRERQFNENQSSAYFTRAFAYLHIGGYPTEKFSDAIQIASKDHEALIDQLNWDYFMRNVPTDKAAQYRDIVARRQQFKTYKESEQ